MKVAIPKLGSRVLQPYYQFIGRNISVHVIMNKAEFASTLVIKLESCS